MATIMLTVYVVVACLMLVVGLPQCTSQQTRRRWVVDSLIWPVKLVVAIWIGISYYIIVRRK